MTVYKRSIYILLIFVFVSVDLFSQVIKRVEPPFWFAGMKEKSLQIMIYGENVAVLDVACDIQGLITGFSKIDNPNYLFIDLIIPDNLNKNFIKLDFYKNKEKVESLNYEIKPRNKDSNQHKGFSTSDVIYLLMPDRFSNGDVTNDDSEKMLEKANRTNPDGRHGGDIQGIINHLDYIRDFGATTIWITPLLENNQPKYTYHGYAISNYYQVDPRFGTNEKYTELVKTAHQKDLKLIMDVVLNHCGSGHWWMNDLPVKDWIHQYNEFTQSNYRSEVVQDPYASNIDKSLQNDGWFDINMPDLNQKNRFLANYLIQNTIWWIEYAGIDGIRLDTQPYSDKDMVAQWAKRIQDEYPSLTIIGEAWLQEISHTAYWQKNTKNFDGYSSNIPVVTDFPMHYAIENAFNEEHSWTNGVSRLYYILSQDFLYSNPMNTIVFLDNHDLTRIFSSFQKDINKLKLAIAFQLTTRGIPSVFYGTELLMEGFAHEAHGIMRSDFAGGWSEDSINAFTSESRTVAQNNVFNYYQNILNWRKTKQVIHSGKLLHFIPENNIYTYFRYTETDCVMIILNNNSSVQTITTDMFAEVLSNYKTGFDIISKSSINDLTKIKLPAKGAMIIELNP
ncbi:MAG: glycoside hydrolase family 13 protein [Bacteroidales bacterium]